MWKAIVIFAILFVGAFTLLGVSASYPAYYNVELEELLDRMEDTLIAQDRELTRVGNELKLQVAYTELLKICLEANDIEYERYPDFLDNRIFRNNELDDETYLYEITLDLEHLLLLSTNKGGLINNEGNYIYTRGIGD